VIEPAQRMIAGVVQRGIDRGEFRAVPVHETVHALIAPMLFMMLHKHSIGACPMMENLIDPRRVIDVHIDLMLHGLQADGAPLTDESSAVPPSPAAATRAQPR
jgi:hypothetical protein